MRHGLTVARIGCQTGRQHDRGSKAMTIGELKEALDDYGNHLAVVIVVERGQHEYSAQIDDVSTTARFGDDDDDTVVTLTGKLRTYPPIKCWHVTTASGQVYGVAANGKLGALSMVADRIARDGGNDQPRVAAYMGTWTTGYGTVIAY